ncbi:ASPIC/UnbV domain-containing protein [Formosa agariphila KMM 3901]|uniref:ASPIC/UnbV domain-containing protein n=1 Tax=Formosa agariphila (strain DSM 15362 / KCTC 12365 / LMG 23005 / KMM 3901 / M-2Alg 35-1) TaxID=1347342 RepID=T2KME0_FORAG|nr:FG-GAP-like repeat-containing protein [Formosa agariphila]CDF79885.1 ASPIC/UnbV domain-containing protein [Formosa agariphila KMM 3901]
MNRIFILLSIVLLSSCVSKKDDTRKTNFVNVKPDRTGVAFANNIIENDTLNYFQFPFLYMGGGVSIGDINNDGLSDIYFTGNMTSNKLYLNKGNMQFEDITEKANVMGDNRWYTGTTMVDINNDGWLDIYVSVSAKFGNTENQLFINNGDNTFTEKAESYGIADKTASIQSTFFDYDNDGLLDLFVGNYPLVPVSQGNEFYHEKMEINTLEDSGHLYKNNGDNTFTDVTEVSGVKNFGLTLGVVAADFNQDDWQDLYVSNDFNVPDYLYLNNGDGTFKEVVKQATNNISMFGMGADVADFNNDGLLDIMQVDMTPNDYKRSKTNMASMNPTSFYQAVDLGLHYQYMQNSLQLNNGVYNKMPVFSNIARRAGVATTDWSWGTLFADFDNDGFKDIIITNGMKRDVNNNDVNMQYQNETFFGETKNLDYKKYPSHPIDNFVFKNNKDYTFSKVNEDWGISYEGFSNGLSYADLDNDGDLDIVMNNLDDVASVFENKTNNSNYINVTLKGDSTNTLGLGTKIKITTKQGEQLQELTLTRGFQSSVAPNLHFGLGDETTIQKMEVIWPDNKQQILEDIKANQILEVSYADASKMENPISETQHMLDITKQSQVDFKHIENSYNDFDDEPLLPHKNSQFGAGVAVGDVNGDGLEDFFVGNATSSSAVMYIQNTDGKFDVLDGPWQKDALYEDMESLLFDADGDGDLDLYVVNGGNDKNRNEDFYQDRIYINTPNGFVKGEKVLPKITSSGLTVKAGDYNQDGKPDLFVGGRIIPGKYPFAAKSYIIKNNGGIDTDLRFEDVTEKVAPSLSDAGLVTSAIWDDFDRDGNLDLLIAGEWMPIRFFRNNGNTFQEVTKKLGFEKSNGWWYSLEKADVDGDGDLDYLAGNLGLNYKYKASLETPFEVYVNDFDENNSMDIVLTYKKQGTQLPLRGRECSSQQVPAIKSRFKTFESFANANLQEIYGENMLEKALHYQAYTFASCWIENKGNGTFKMHELPMEAQFTSINKFLVFDYNKDEFPDILIAGNLYGSEVETPRNDAGVGLILTGNAQHTFDVVAPSKSNLFVKGDVRGLKSIQIKEDQAFLFSRNNENLQLIKVK